MTDITEKDIAELRYNKKRDEVLRLNQDRSRIISAIIKRLESINDRRGGAYLYYDQAEMDRKMIALHAATNELMAAIRDLNDHATAADQPQLKMEDVAVIGSVSLRSA